MRAADAGVGRRNDVLGAWQADGVFPIGRCGMVTEHLLEALSHRPRPEDSCPEEWLSEE